MEGLCTGVEVRQVSCLCPVFLLPLFGVTGDELTSQELAVVKLLPGKASNSSVAEDDTMSEVPLSVDVFFGSIFVVFGGLPFISASIRFPSH